MFDEIMGVRDHAFWGRLTKEEYDWLGWLAEKEKISRSGLLRRLLRDAWEREKRDSIK